MIKTDNTKVNINLLEENKKLRYLLADSSLLLKIMNSKSTAEAKRYVLIELLKIDNEQ